jgi:hypothetical protein
LRAEATLNWNGQQPQIIAGSGSSENLIVPVPAPSTAIPATGSKHILLVSRSSQGESSKNISYRKKDPAIESYTLR